MTYAMLQPITEDDSLHHYSRRYLLILNRLDPKQFPTPYVRGMTEPFHLNTKNKDILCQFYRHIEVEASLSIARRARLILLISNLGEFLGEKVFNELTREDIEELVSVVRRRPNWSLTTQNYHLKALKKFLKYLNGGIEYPPCISWLKIRERKNSPVKKEDLVTEEEIGRILKVNTNALHRCLFALLWEGLRIGEIGNLRCKNISFEGREVYISVKGKTGERTVLSISGSPYIRQWLDQHPTQNPEDWLFVITSNYNRGQRLGYQSLRTIVNNGCEKAGIGNKRIHPHIFRHSSITDRRRKGMRQREASAFYGVSSQVMSAVYDHLADADVHNEIRRVLGAERVIETTLNKIEPKSCPFCQKINAHYATSCLNCGNSFSTQDGLRNREQNNALEKENQVIRNELATMRSIMGEFSEFMKAMTPEQKAQILQRGQNIQGGQ